MLNKLLNTGQIGRIRRTQEVHRPVSETNTDNDKYRISSNILCFAPRTGNCFTEKQSGFYIPVASRILSLPESPVYQWLEGSEDR